MFLGEHNHSLDVKGRVILPARFRDQLAVAYITSEVDGCLALWPPADFEMRAQEMKERSRGTPEDRSVARFFFAGAQESSPDKQG
ncbi:MAG: division/cell wall cluster transcriptional repressor MraZ, partial [Actinobacteria bacterium]|nr:division/cell wall cluster transcriptional repressor MraZ [Actinomycetota bacterium]